MSNVIQVMTHPEQFSQVWIGNFTAQGYQSIGWKTKRSGHQAINIYGEKVATCPDLFPVFVGIAELENAGFQIDYVPYKNRPGSPMSR